MLAGSARELPLVEVEAREVDVRECSVLELAARLLIRLLGTAVREVGPWDGRCLVSREHLDGGQRLLDFPEHAHFGAASHRAGLVGLAMLAEAVAEALQLGGDQGLVDDRVALFGLEVLPRAVQETAFVQLLDRLPLVRSVKLLLDLGRLLE